MTAGRNLPRMKNMSVSRGVWGLVLSGMLVSGACWLNAADEAPAAGLRGILPAQVPGDLTATIADLPENWKAWGTALSAELTTLYETEGVDVPAQRKAIAALRARVATVNTHAADPRYRTIQKQLVSLAGGLKRRLDVAQAALDTLERGPEVRAARIEAARRRVAEAAQAVDGYLGSIRNGQAWVKYLQVSEVRGAVGRNDGNSVKTLGSVQSRLKEKEKLADARARDFLARPQIAAYERAVDDYQAAIAAPNASANSPELRKSLAELLNAIDQYESLHATSASAAVRKAFESIKSTAPDGGEAISQALRTNYLNYNMRVAVTEAFLNKFVGQSRDETGPVVDFILGADVSGNQNTHTNVSAKLIPSNNSAQFDITANGAVSASTAGVTDQATVYTQGNHYFTATKRIVFNGDRFSTYPAQISISTNNTTTGADTDFGLLSGFADRIAVRRAEGMRGESEAIAASRLQDRVLPQFNAEVDKQFGPNGKANSDIANRLNALRELKLYPDAKVWSTTGSELRMASRLMDPKELGGSEPNPALVLGRGATLLFHESVMNNSLDTLELEGKTMTEDDLKAQLENNFSKLLGREVKLRDNKPAPADESGIKNFVFDKADPIRVQVADGTVVLTIRSGFQQEGKEDIPTQVISMPLTFTVNMQSVIVEPGDVSVAAAEQAEGGAGKQLARAGVIKKKFAAAFPRRELKRVSYVKHENKQVQVAVTRIRALDGWLSITVE